ncbi:MAG: MarR family transcriptional regulator [Ilumatobacteraceae bacterium]
MSIDPIEDSYERWIALGWPGPDEMAAFMSVLRIHKLLVDRAHEVLAPSRLSIIEHACLVYLAMSEEERQPLSKIAERVMIGPGRCNYMINKLEAAGYLRREPHPSDGRTTLAVLTDEGRELVLAGLTRLAAIRNGFGDVGNQDLHLLRELAAELLGSARQ